jgi:hypothetical protein
LAYSSRFIAFGPDFPHLQADFRRFHADFAGGRGAAAAAGDKAPRAVLTAHVVVGIAVIATNLIAGAWGSAAWLRREPSVGFWYALRIAQVTVVLQIALGAILLLSGREAANGLHYLYGILPILVSLLAEAARAGAADRELAGLDFESLPRNRQSLIALEIVRRETGIMAVSALVILLLALRAAGTS